MRLARRTALVAVAALIVWAPAASASVTVGESGGSLLVASTDASGANEPSVRFESPNITVNNSEGVDLDASAGTHCHTVPPYQVVCDNVYDDLQVQFADSNDDLSIELCFTTAEIDMGNGTNVYRGPACAATSTYTVGGGTGHDNFAGSGDDLANTVEVLYGFGAEDTLYGGGGDDTSYGGEGPDFVTDDAGNDHLYGEAGDDVVRGGVGNDVEDGGPGDDRVGYSPGVRNDDDQGADVLTGGDGVDRLLLDAHSGGMTVNLDGQPNDGSPGEGDNIASDFENIDGTGGNDTFIGSPGPDQFSGGFGNDDIHGGAGDDNLYGGGGDDTMNGDAGNDKVEGANGSDSVDGGAGADQIYGDIGSCSISCSSDADTLFARDEEKDAVDCGGGADSAQVDSLDVVAFCASVDRSADPRGSGGNGGGDGAGNGGGGNGGGSSPGFALKVAGSITLKALLKSGLVVKLTCPGACKSAAKLSHKTKQLGSASKTLLKAGTAKLTVKLTRKGKSAARKLGHGKLTVRVRATDAAGKPTSLTRTVKLKR